MCAAQIWVHIHYQFAFLTPTTENKASKPFWLFNDFGCLFRYFGAPSLVSLAFFSQSHIVCSISAGMHVEWGARDVLPWHETKMLKTIEPNAIVVVVVMKRFNIAVQYGIYTKNDSIGNCVSILNVIIIVGTAILILVWLAYRVGFFSFFILFFSVSMIFSCTSIVWFERNGHSIWFFYW